MPLERLKQPFTGWEVGDGHTQEPRGTVLYLLQTLWHLAVVVKGWVRPSGFLISKYPLLSALLWSSRQADAEDVVQASRQTSLNTVPCSKPNWQKVLKNANGSSLHVNLTLCIGGFCPLGYHYGSTLKADTGQRSKGAL